MNISIAKRISFLFTLFALLILGLVWTAQNFFLEPYYIYQKSGQIENAEQHLKGLMEETGLGDPMQEAMDEMAEKLHGWILLMDEDGRILQQANEETSGRGGRMHHSSPSHHSMMRHMEKGRASMHQTQGQSGPQNFLTLTTPIEPYYLFFQVPLQPMEEVLGIAAQFNLLLAVLALVLALFLSLGFSKSITRPLLQLNHAVQQKSTTGFSLPWKKIPADEIGQLGMSFQQLTHELDQTIQALQMELDKEKNLEKLRKQFVARVSHELQTPIALIQGYAEALEDGVASTEEEAKEYLETIQEESHQMSRIVKDLLDLEQLESGVFRVEQKPLDLKELLEETKDRFQLFFQEKNLQVKIILPKEPVIVIGDYQRLEQVMYNLLKNALNHSYQGGILSLALERKEKKAKVTVFNTGDPIPEEKISLIWESFYRGDDRRAGNGLGLAIVKSVLDLHDSDYGVENKENGVAFFFKMKLS
ncbi:sensor histidine kinase [Tindallia californiensis]|uniref:histidine kinase n=1 Tax=Tindallia californiensis TaxID=159292 RepID=A0A1H3PUV8_9FIRM|nr:HAMP domain-containing sensor histidine kinase [Tindallia californiensis]SDZ04753.1 Signal transduction histidine kinase [Tindallia californiensis]